MATLTPTTAATVEREAAFADEFERLYALAVRAARSRGLDREAAADVAQEAMTTTYAHWARIGREAFLDAWVVRVANNAAIDVHRRNTRGNSRAVQPALQPAAPDHTDRLVLEQALQKLPRRQREVVVMRYLDDLDENEVAEALGCSVGTVRQSAARGRTKLAEILGDLDLSSFRAPAETTAPDERVRDEVIERGVMLRAARRAARIATVVVVGALVALGAYFWNARPGSSPRDANQVTTTVAERVSTTVPTTLSPAPAPVPEPAPAPLAAPPAPPPMNESLVRNPAEFLTLSTRVVSESVVMQLGVPVPVTTYEVTISNRSGRTIDAAEFGDSQCRPNLLFKSVGAVVPLPKGACASVLGSLEPGERKVITGSAVGGADASGSLQIVSAAPSQPGDLLGVLRG